jgi:hypothetical protein
MGPPVCAEGKVMDRKHARPRITLKDRDAIFADVRAVLVKHDLSPLTLSRLCVALAKDARG